MKLTLFPHVGSIEDVCPAGIVDAALRIGGEGVVVESGSNEVVPLGFRYLYAAQALDRDGSPVVAESARTLVCIGMNPNTAAMASSGALDDDATTRDLRRIAGNTLTAPGGEPFTRVVFVNMAPFRGVRGPELGVHDSLGNLDTYRAEHDANCEIVPCALDWIRAAEGSLDIVAMWGDIRDKANGRFALAGVRDLGPALLALADHSNVRWYCFGRTASGSPRNYAGLRYAKGMSAAQKALRAGTLSAVEFEAAASPSSWLSLADPRALVDANVLAAMFKIPRGVSRAD